jgi:hypothetical protein
MTYKAITEHVLAFGGVTGHAQLTEAVKRSSLDVDAVYWDCVDKFLVTHVTAWKRYTYPGGQNSCGYDYTPLLSVTISRLQPVTDDAT